MLISTRYGPIGKARRRRENGMRDLEPELMKLVRAIVAGDEAAVSNRLATTPALAHARFERGATRQEADVYFIDAIKRYIVAGDSALHVAAAAYRRHIVQALLASGADVRAKNRRGAEPLHAAAAGVPCSDHWNPAAQAETVKCLIEAGADPNALDKSGVAPLHVAVRTRCAAGVKALLDSAADPQRRNKNGSTPMLLATRTTGRGGSTSPEAKAQQQEIVHLLLRD